MYTRTFWYKREEEEPILFTDLKTGSFVNVSAPENTIVPSVPTDTDKVIQLALSIAVLAKT